MWPTVENIKSHFNPRHNGPLFLTISTDILCNVGRGLILSASSQVFVSCIWGDIAIFRDLIPPDTDILAYLVHIMTSTISPHKQQIRQFSLSPLSLSSRAGHGEKICSLLCMGIWSCIDFETRKLDIWNFSISSYILDLRSCLARVEVMWPLGLSTGLYTSPPVWKWREL